MVRARWLCLVVAVALAQSAIAAAQRLTLNVDREIYEGVPFTLTIRADGFEEEPTPDAPEIEVPGCRVRFLGVSPSVSSMVQIINGRRSESRTVTFQYRYRVEPSKAGRYTLPPIVMTQDTANRGVLTARTAGGSFQALGVEPTRDMRLQVELPERPVYIGETFPVAIDWYLRKTPSEQSFVIPLFEADGIAVEPSDNSYDGSLQFAAGALDLELPYQKTNARLDGSDYTRFRFHALVTASRAGAIELAPARVSARLETGRTSSDSFLFRRRETRLYMAEDVPRRLSVRPLPQVGRPPGFVNAIGTSFSMTVQASRTVVQVGDPIELLITIRGDGRLAGLALPDLDAPGGLDPALFSVPDESPPGSVDQDGAAKTFVVTVRLRSAEAVEIPALPFPYFDTAAGEYKIATSEPIALSVKGSAMVGAADVVGARATEPVQPGMTTSPKAESAPGFLPGSLVGADLSLSTLDQTLETAASADDVRPLLWLLYGAPLLIFAWRVWWVRTHAERGRSSELRTRVEQAESAIAAAARQPAGEAAPAILSALRALARLTTGESTEDRVLFERIETEGYDPEGRERPLPKSLLDEARGAVERWQRAVDGATSATAARAGAALLLCLTSAVLAAPIAAEAADPPAALTQARSLYQQALGEQDRVRRTRTFADAERQLRELSAGYPNSPELLVDAGNAALGAQDLGRATLAYRRALRLDPGNERGAKNLAWVRSRAPRWLPQPAGKSAVDTLFFWHHQMSSARRQVVGGVAFAVAILLLAPWSIAGAGTMRRLALLPLLVWLAMIGSAIVDGGDGIDAVVMHDDVPLYSADSEGAPLALSAPLPAGAELTIVEARERWTRVTLADGTRGWLRTHTVERVVPGT